MRDWPEPRFSGLAAIAVGGFVYKFWKTCIYVYFSVLFSVFFSLMFLLCAPRRAFINFLTFATMTLLYCECGILLYYYIIAIRIIYVYIII